MRRNVSHTAWSISLIGSTFYSVCTLGWPKKGIERVVVKFKAKGQEKAWVMQSSKNIRFFILFIPRSSDCKNNFPRIFGNYIYTTFLMNLFHFPYFDPTKKSAKKKYYEFQRHSLFTIYFSNRFHFLQCIQLL